MSGSVAEALLASGSKKLPLLPPPPKIKKEPKTFTFELELPESNEKTYPEFSWTELVRNAKQKELKKKAESGTPTLNPYASDDEEDLKAMAAKFEAKYNNTPGTVTKKKRRVEDYIDKGAGYDETDPFIDNSDVYDEVVPADLQTAHGGFYINSGSLDFKEVELSEDDEDSLSQPPKVAKVKKAKTKITPVGQVAGVFPKLKNPVGRPPGVGNKRPLSLDKTGLPKKRKIPIGPDGKPISKPAKINAPSKLVKTDEITPGKPKTVQAISSSTSSSSSSSGESSSSSDSESSSSEETEEKKETPKVKHPIPVKVKATITSSAQPKQFTNIIRLPDTKVVSAPVAHGHPLPKRIKTKNVPLNPKLHPNLSPASAMPALSSAVSMNVTPPQQMQSKVLNKDLIKANGGGSINISPRTQSPSGLMSIPTSSPALKVPPPKPVTTPMISPGVTISAVPSQAAKMPNLPTKPKMKTKAPASSINASPSHLDIFSSLAGYAGLPNFAPNLSPSSSLLKGGMNMVGAPKAMPNLKKMTQASSAEKLVHKQSKAALHNKPVKSKPKPTSNLPLTPPTSHASAFTTSGTSGNTYLTTYKTPPPPLAGPGVEISKVRTSSVINSGVNSTPKAISSSTTSFSPSSLGLATVSLAHTPNSNALTTSALINAGITSILNASTNSLVSSVPSSLTVQRLPQSITITPTPQQSIFPTGGISSNKSLSMETKATKHISAFDMSALLQNPTVSYANTLISMGNPKSGAAKPTNSIANNRDLQRK